MPSRCPPPAPPPIGRILSHATRVAAAAPGEVKSLGLRILRQQEADGWGDPSQIEEIRAAAPLAAVQGEGRALEHHEHVLLHTAQESGRAGYQCLLGEQLLGHRVGGQPGDGGSYAGDPPTGVHADAADGHVHSPRVRDFLGQVEASGRPTARLPVHKEPPRGLAYLGQPAYARQLYDDIIQVP